MISSVFEVQQYREIAARSSGYFIIADHGSVYREIPDEYTDLGNRTEDEDADCAHEGLDVATVRAQGFCGEHFDDRLGLGLMRLPLRGLILQLLGHRILR